jgi:hypothetical protein
MNGKIKLIPRSKVCESMISPRQDLFAQARAAAETGESR